jgi:hypothetical protein
MPTIVLQSGCAWKKATITADAALDPLIGPVPVFVRACCAMHYRVPLQFAKLERDASNLNLYRYQFKAQDGRNWRQQVTFDGSANPLLSFDVSDSWRLSEYELQRPIRDACISMVVPHGLSLAKCEFV